MRRLSVFTSLFLALGLSLMAGPASAHVLKIDGNIAAVLHINPDDNPVSGQHTQYLLYFDDSTGQFSLPKCNCQVNIKEDGHVIATQPVQAVDAQDSSNIYTFPRPDVYTIEVTGQPKKPGEFQPFALDYLERVGEVDHQSLPLLLGIGMGLMIGLVLLAAYALGHNTDNK